MLDRSPGAEVVTSARRHVCRARAGGAGRVQNRHAPLNCRMVSRVFANLQSLDSECTIKFLFFSGHSDSRHDRPVRRLSHRLCILRSLLRSLESRLRPGKSIHTHCTPTQGLLTICTGGVMPYEV